MFDPHCLDLATLFLEDRVGAEDQHRSDLAQHIQDAIESWIDCEGLPEKNSAGATK